MNVKNFQSIAASGDVELGPITLLVGRNNSGKSSLLKSIALMQAGIPTSNESVRIGAEMAVVKLNLADPELKLFGYQGDPGKSSVSLEFFLLARDGAVNGAISFVEDNGNQVQVRAEQIQSVRPRDFIVPVFTRRKVDQFEMNVKREYANSVSVSDRTLTSRLAQITSANFPEAVKYREGITSILGFSINTYLTDNGMAPGRTVSSSVSIPLDRMGEGVSSALRLAVELAEASGKLFLIEEPENDLHPEALRALLDMIIASSDSNQFVISTHSDLVLKYLGSTPESRIHHVSLPNPGQGTESTRIELVADRESRLMLLAELGYEPELPGAWLVLEESTAERVIKQVLIPHFEPRLAEVQTMSASGVTQISKRFGDIQRTISFANLSGRYKLKTWVIVDGDEAGKKEIQKLQNQYKSWPDSHFLRFSEPQFERYYPPRFENQVIEALKRRDDYKETMKLKGDLAESICAWVAENPEEAIPELQESAAAAIATLRAVANDLATLKAGSISLNP